jgi:hypothetical protein
MLQHNVQNASVLHLQLGNLIVLLLLLAGRQQEAVAERCCEAYLYMLQHMIS